MIAFVTIAIRSAVPTDLEALNKVFRRASLSNSGDRGHLLAHPEYLVLSDNGIAEGRTRVAVDPEAGIVGFASWLVADCTIEMEDLFVDPDWMRQGIGRSLVNDIVDLAGRQGFYRIEVTANPHAHSFYESVGFTVDHLVETRFYPGQRMHRTVP
jgi:GNAT superfamily N-acetyltransferase